MTQVKIDNNYMTCSGIFCKMGDKYLPQQKIYVKVDGQWVLQYPEQ